MSIVVVKCNDVYFPSGNEFGDSWEPLYKAKCGDIVAYGRTPEQAESNIKKLLPRNNLYLD